MVNIGEECPRCETIRLTENKYCEKCLLPFVDSAPSELFVVNIWKKLG